MNHRGHLTRVAQSKIRMSPRRGRLFAVPVVMALTAIIAGCGEDRSAEEIIPATLDSPASPPAPAPAQAQPSTAGRTIALITGDRVTVPTSGRVTVAAGPGRGHIAFFRVKDGDHLRVIPSDALPLIRIGQIDPRLFDVTQLLEDGYDRVSEIPVIVKHDGKAGVRARVGTLAGPSSRMVGELTAIHAVAMRVASTGELWRAMAGGNQRLVDGVTKIWLDGLRKPTLDISVPQIGAPQAWQAGFDGTGVTVAVLDTGIDATHPDLVDRVVGERNFVADLPFFGEDALDHVGHGTHVASTIAGSGAASQGRFRGVAPGAHLLDGKVCMVFGCPESAILAGMAWAAQSGAKVISMSLGGSDGPELDPLEEAVNTLTAQYGVLFVIAAGNSGETKVVDSPGSADAALTVAAFDKSDRLASFSSRGPRLGDAALKPEIAAPGVAITAARSAASPGSVLQRYTTLSGTSMATPHVAGAAAIVAQRHPDFTPAQLKATLMSAAHANPEIDSFAQGAGRVDVARAIQQQITAEPAAFSCGLQTYPHGDDVPVTHTVTYRNAGTTDATLALTIQALGPHNTPVPEGLFTVSAASVTVPASGTASVEVTCDTRIEGITGPAGGRLTARSGALNVETPFGVNREPESYDLTVLHTDRAGNPADVVFTAVVLADPDQVFHVLLGSSASTTRLAKGRYQIFSNIFDDAADGTSTESFVLQPPFELTSDQTITLDARLAQPIAVTVPNPEAQLVGAEIDAFYWQPRHGLGIGALFQGPAYCAQLGSPGPVPGFAFSFGALWAKPDGFGGFDDSPYSYATAWFFEHEVPAGLVRHLGARDLATVHAHYAVQAAGDTGSRAALALVTPADPLIGEEAWIWPQELAFHLPTDRTDYVNTEGGVRWLSWFNELQADTFALAAYAENPDTAYQANRSYQQTWNKGVFGPSLSLVSASRVGDRLNLFVPWFGDPVGRFGLAPDLAHQISLFKDGVEIPAVRGDGVFDVSPELAHYRLEIDYIRQLDDMPSSHVKAAWTFASAGSGPGTTALPLSSISFRPRLDDHNTAASRSLAVVPIEVFAQPGSSASPLHRLEVEVSFDDGSTWHRAPVVGPAHDPAVVVFHPAGRSWVSLRVHAVDGAGNTVDETILRAYRLR